jgi:hypothetical protein
LLRWRSSARARHAAWPAPPTLHACAAAARLPAPPDPVSKRAARPQLTPARFLSRWARGRGIRQRGRHRNTRRLEWGRRVDAGSGASMLGALLPERGVQTGASTSLTQHHRASRASVVARSHSGRHTRSGSSGRWAMRRGCLQGRGRARREGSSPHFRLARSPAAGVERPRRARARLSASSADVPRCAGPPPRPPPT